MSITLTLLICLFVIVTAIIALRYVIKRSHETNLLLEEIRHFQVQPEIQQIHNDPRWPYYFQREKQIILEDISDIHPSEIISKLVCDLSIAKINYNFAYMYITLPRHYMHLLHLINQLGGVTTISEVMKIYNTPLHISSGKTFDQWISPLINQDLLTQEQSVFRITCYGNEFLVWLVQQQFLIQE